MFDADAPPEDDSWRRRMAIQMVAQLPDNRADALAVLSYAEKLIREFVHQPSSAARLTLVASHDKPFDQAQGKAGTVAVIDPVRGDAGRAT